MKSTFFIAATSAFLFAAGTAWAVDDDAEREKVKSNLLLPECSWSKMEKQEYDECQKKRRIMKVMTPKERAQYLDHLEPNSISVDDNGRRIGNGIPANLPARGGR